MAPKTLLPFPPEPERFVWRPDQLPDAWAATLELTDYGAWMSLGPAGDGSGAGEAVELWQGVLDVLRDAVADAYTKGGKPTGRVPPKLVEAVKREKEAGRLELSVDDGIGIRARTLGAWLMGTALEDIAAGRELGTCQECGRRMVLTRKGQVHCGAVCRVASSRKNTKKKESR